MFTRKVNNKPIEEVIIGQSHFAIFNEGRWEIWSTEIAIREGAADALFVVDLRDSARAIVEVFDAWRKSHPATTTPSQD